MDNGVYKEISEREKIRRREQSRASHYGGNWKKDKNGPIYGESDYYKRLKNSNH